MFRSVRPYLEEAGITELVVCYQGAAVVDPVSGDVPAPRAGPARDRTRGDRGSSRRSGTRRTVTSPTGSTSTGTRSTRACTPSFQHLPVEEVGDLATWLTKPPTKLVAVADPAEIPALRAALASAFGDRLFLTTSLPYLLELGNPAVSKGTGSRSSPGGSASRSSAIVAFGDGENDIELIDEAGFGIAVEDANPLLLERADWSARARTRRASPP